jgi:putative oxidoreductase
MERMKIWARLEPPVYAALRILTGLMFATHGMQKLFGWFGGHMHPRVGSLPWFAGIIELTCGLLIAVGLFTRPAAFLAAGEMAVAYFGMHWKLHMDHAQWAPIANHGELAALYALLFVFFMAYGPGLASVDGAILRRRAVQPESRRTIPAGPLAGEH